MVLKRCLIGLCAVLLVGAARGPRLSRIEKLTRVLSLEDRRSTGGGELERYLRDSDRSVRRRAILAAGRIADRESIFSLIELMNDSEHEVRQMAAFALGLIGDPRAVERLTASLEDVDALVRGRSAEALGRIGDSRAAPAVARMVQASLPPGSGLVTVRGDDPASLRDPWLEPRLGLFALARFKDDPRAARSVLLSGGRSRFDWWVATWTAMRLEDPGSRPVLLAAATSSDPLSRAYAARGLAAIADRESVALLETLTLDEHTLVVVDALRALGTLGGGRTAIVARLKDEQPEHREEALKVLTRLPPERSLRARIVPLVGDEDAAVRTAALAALAHTDPEGLALVLSGLDPDPMWFVRSDMARELGEEGGELAEAILFNMLEHPDDMRLLPAVLEGLRLARGGDAAETLRSFLEHADYGVRAAAAEGLGALEATAATDALVQAYRRGLTDPEPEARLAAVDALGVSKAESAEAALADVASSDPERVVRQRAGEALRSRGRPAPDPGSATPQMAPLDYRRALGPLDPLPGRQVYTPRARIDTTKGLIEMHLNVVEAPLASAAFVDLARRGFFNGLTFHRVVSGFVVQGGCPRGDGRGGPGYTLRCELGQQPFGRGAVGMALAGRDTGGSQFFISRVPAPHLDGEYTLLGWVTEGMEVVDALRPGDVITNVVVWDGS